MLQLVTTNDDFDPLPSHLHLKIYIFVSDAGPDQCGSQSLIRSDTMDRLWTIIFVQHCLLHQAALCVKRQLSNLDPYWSMLAKLVNLWRTACYSKVTGFEASVGLVCLVLVITVRMPPAGLPATRYPPV